MFDLPEKLKGLYFMHTRVELSREDSSSTVVENSQKSLTTKLALNANAPHFPFEIERGNFSILNSILLKMRLFLSFSPLCKRGELVFTTALWAADWGRCGRKLSLQIIGRASHRFDVK